MTSSLESISKLLQAISAQPGWIFYWGFPGAQRPFD